MNSAAPTSTACANGAQHADRPRARAAERPARKNPWKSWSRPIPRGNSNTIIFANSAARRDEPGARPFGFTIVFGELGGLIEQKSSMITNLHSSPHRPVRVVVLGAGGFIGGAVARCLRSQAIEVAGLTRDSCDLLAPRAASRLAAELRD